MKGYLLMIFCIGLFIQAGYTQKKTVNDSSVIEVRMFSKTAIDNYKADRDFQYDQSLQPTLSLWDQFWNWVWNRIEEMLSTKTGKRAFQTVLILIAVAIIVYAILKFTGMTGSNLFGNQNTAEKLPYSAHEEDIHAISFEEAIAKAINEQNFRLAIRLLYLQTLKKLTDRTLIHWQINKTNVAYVQELAGTNYQQSFNQLTNTFEANWYGDRHIQPDAFRMVQEEFNQFNKQIR